MDCKSSLYQASLVSQAWSKEVQPILFRRVEIDFKPLSTWDFNGGARTCPTPSAACSRITCLLALIQSNPKLGGYIRELTLKGDTKGCTYVLNECAGKLSALASSLTHLGTLRINWWDFATLSHSEDWWMTALTDETRTTIGRLCSLPSLTEIRIYPSLAVPDDIWAVNPSLKVLQIEGREAFRPEGDARTGKYPSLKTLSLNRIDRADYLPNFFRRHSPLLLSLNDLEISGNASFHPQVTDILQSLRGTLTRFSGRSSLYSWSASTDPNAPLNGIEFSGMRSLRSVSLDWRSVDLTDKAPPALLQTLSTIPWDQIEEVHIAYAPFSPGNAAREAPTYDPRPNTREIDALLARYTPPLPGTPSSSSSQPGKLRNISLQVVFRDIPSTTRYQNFTAQELAPQLFEQAASLKACGDPIKLEVRYGKDR
ncbi:hypothetical protein CC1G_15665 [Coprinopsis cinerea okayama7|uniref:F-box domain-containing protein n=1 Tax=Coprinopsis cinerea (strain Okayama-7 / 130 / ATCC MYA-4618 / FGSC 9003) TaxID=240176 RepID=D6RQC5_COPC7|nr:hypothetical protein CC1G_15665 [Coprinopsis cinerea okayama7\|eukprot:XP_002910235.1 hypothetical protein CC1G_15665 [Coprinopsis cinerea okayama7\